MDKGLCDGLWHNVMIEHNMLEVSLALDIQTVVTKSLMGLQPDMNLEFLVNNQKVCQGLIMKYNYRIDKG